MFGHKRKVLICVPRDRYKGPGKHTRGEHTMTSTNSMYGTEGSSALVPSYPMLTLIEGSIERGGVCEQPQVRDESVVRPRLTRREALTVVVCTLMVAAGLLVALVVSNASASANLDSALSSIPAQEVVVEPGDSIWGLAGQHQVDGYSTSELAQWIFERNSLSTSSLQPGQVLLVPASN